MLREAADCTVSTLIYRWRADAFFEIEATPRVLPVPLDLKEILGTAIVEFEKYIGEFDLNPFKPVSFKVVDDAIKKVVEWHNKRWVRWLILAAAATIIIGGCALFLYWYLMRITQHSSQATAVAAMLSRFRDIFGLIQGNAQQPAQMVQPDPTGARARSRTNRTQDEDL